MIDRTLLLELVEEAALAPSVHNVQPARWRLEDDALVLIEDCSRALPVGDPSGRDSAISLGAAAEGLRLAAGRRGLEATMVRSEDAGDGRYRPIARFHLEPGGSADPLAGFADARRSWRADFAKTSPEDRRLAATLAGDSVTPVTDPALLATVATLFDRASLGFMRDRGFRRELRSWMRLSRRHPRWARDGLNAEAMALGRVEAAGAGLVLGKMFGLLDRLGLASPLLAEGGKIEQAAAVLIFHRPVGEDPFVSGMHFYRCWLAVEQAGFGAAVLAALADDPDAAKELAALVPSGQHIVSAFRIGRRPVGKIAPRARRPLDELLV